MNSDDAALVRLIIPAERYFEAAKNQMDMFGIIKKGGEEESKFLFLYHSGMWLLIARDLYLYLARRSGLLFHHEMPTLAIYEAIEPILPNELRMHPDLANYCRRVDEIEENNEKNWSAGMVTDLFFEPDNDLRRKRAQLYAEKLMKFCEDGSF